VVGLTLLLVTYWLPRGWALIIALIAIPILALLASLLLFQSLGYFASFIPVLAGVFVHELIEHNYEYHMLLRQQMKLNVTARNR